MTLFRYFKTKDIPTPEQTGIGQKETKSTNRRLETLFCDSSHAGTSGKRKAAKHLEETTAKVGKYAAVNGVAAARRHFREEVGDMPESARTCMHV